MKKVVILSGGGAKGNLQVACLAELEKSGILNGVDMYFGSSVGAINASILATMAMTAQKLCEIYPDMTREIFTPRVKFLKKFGVPYYDTKNFINIFERLKLSTIKMKDCLIKLVVSSVDLTNKKMVYFKSTSDKDKERLVMDCDLNSFSAPVYFGERDVDEDQIKYGDGGMGTDNLPVSEAIMEAMINGWLSEPIQFIIVGCGFTEDIDNYFDNKGKGVFYQVGEYMRPTEGGLAREMSRDHQLGFIKALCNSNKNVSMRYYDIAINKKLNIMDGLQYINEYHTLGKIASKEPLISIN